MFAIIAAANAADADCDTKRGPAARVHRAATTNVRLDVRFLGIDYGHRRIGLALSDATGMLARPWKTIARTGNSAQVATDLAGLIATLVAEDDGLEAVVLGLPKALSGDPTEQTAVVLALAEALRAKARVPLVLQDERLSSREAERLLARRLRDWRDRKPLLDAAAAAVILQDYLDGRSPARDLHELSEDQES
ncbi:MAG TPA: Holliday junction resolvase RuvX [Vicinamibacterales bacterium]|nr:Holliday junction resolvase RuvX [Vicinamibacterales bacterium]